MYNLFGRLSNNSGTSVNGISGIYAYTITNCYNQADIDLTAKSSSQANGISMQSNISNSFNTGNIEVHSSGNSNAGGISSGERYGAAEQGVVTRCANWGNVVLKSLDTFTTSSYTQGAYGIGKAAANDCLNAGTIYAESNTSTNQGSTNISAFGVGFLRWSSWGQLEGTKMSYNVGEVISRNQSWYKDGSVFRYDGLPFYYQWAYDSWKYNDEDMSYYMDNHIWYNTTPSITSHGTPLSPTEFTQIESFVSFDFNTVWDINPEINNGWPYLRNQVPAWRDCTILPKLPDCAIGRQFITAIPIRLNEIINASDKYSYFSFIPSISGEYYFESVFDGAMNDVIWYIYDENQNTFRDTLGNSYGRTYGTNFQRSVYLYAEKTYYLRVNFVDTIIGDIPIRLRNENIINTDEEIVAADKASLTWNAIRGINIDQNSVITNLKTLPTIGERGSTIAWLSSNPAVSNTGIVTRPSYGSDNVTGMLTATLVKGNESALVEFNLTVLAFIDEIIRGDVNGDGFVTMQDVLLIYQYVRGKISFTPEQIQAADINHDVVINMQDVLLAYQYFRGKIDTF